VRASKREPWAQGSEPQQLPADSMTAKRATNADCDVALVTIDSLPVGIGAVVRLRPQGGVVSTIRKRALPDTIRS
jgi:hypothetical protein